MWSLDGFGPGRFRAWLSNCVVALLVVVASCSGSEDGQPAPTASVSTSARTESVAATVGVSTSRMDSAEEVDSNTVVTTTPASTTLPPTTSTTEIDPSEGLDPSVRQATAPWPTEWGVNSIDLSELLLGIPALDPRDGIPPIDDPIFEPVSVASGWLDDRVPGALVLLGGAARFYPLGILHRHEIVNDEIAGIPVAVTYCPLCNTAVTFDRRVEGEVLRFGVSGLLRNSDLVMWDDRTVSLWQQVTGEAIVGSATGTVLSPIATAIVAFGEFASSYPDGLSLSTDMGTFIAYGSNPYEGYSSRSAPYPFYTGEIDPRYPALERVVGVTEGGKATAYPFPLMSEIGVVNDYVGGIPVAVFWGGNTADALDTHQITDGRSIGTGLAYLRTVDGQELTFVKEGNLFRDQETSSQWTLLGEAISGPLAGTRLELAVHRNDFWFAWGAFFPDGTVYEA